VEKLRKAYGDGLVAVVLYGSAAAGDHQASYSDYNILCVLNQVTPRELAMSEDLFRWWREQGSPAPLLLSEEEVHNSADSFAIEFRDMKERRKVLYGPDVIAHLKIEGHYYRAQVEHELRSKLLRLRQQGAAQLSNPEALLKLCLDSVSTFCVLGRHALLAGHVDAKSERRAIVHQLAKTLSADMSAFDTLLDIREDKAGVDPGDPGELFARYLQSVQQMIKFVDGLEGKS